MRQLQVRFYKQRAANDCGAAVLRMVLWYYDRNTQFLPAKFYRQYAHREPYRSGNYRVTTDDIISEARMLGYSADWGRITPTIPELIQHVTLFVETLGIPLIACQRLSDKQHTIGHYRLIVGVEQHGVVLHDPCSTTLRWPWERLFDYWRATGENVTGGVAIWIARKPVPENPLLPDQPNLWSNVPYVR